MADPRIPILAAGATLLIGALAYDPLAAITAASSSAALAIVALEWRRRPVLNAATKLAHTFCFSDGSCKPELQELAKAILLWNRKGARHGS